MIRESRTSESTRLLLVYLLCNCCVHIAFSLSTVPVAKRNGMNFLNGQWSAPKFNSSEALTSLEQLANGTGLNWVAITYCWFQWDVDSTGPIYAKPSTPTTEQLGAVVDAAHSRGIRVFFRPCIDPDWSNPLTRNTWRGEIGRFFNASDWDTWFGYYLPFIAAQAAVAQSLGVDMFAVGMEYVTASWQTAHWRSVVAAVRPAYTAGPITYCANHGNENNVLWWDAVDEISIDAYYPLLPWVQQPSTLQLVAAWQPIVVSLKNLSATQGNKSINFAEIGYCSTTGANTNPASCGTNPVPNAVNLTAQYDLYEAFFEAVYPQSFFRGVFWWAWLTNPEDGGVNDTGFSPHGKPAEKLLLQQYGNRY